jgi:hypothetical protein
VTNTQAYLAMALLTKQKGNIMTSQDWRNNTDGVGLLQVGRMCLLPLSAGVANSSGHHDLVIREGGRQRPRTKLS